MNLSTDNLFSGLEEAVTEEDACIVRRDGDLSGRDNPSVPIGKAHAVFYYAEGGEEGPGLGCALREKRRAKLDRFIRELDGRVLGRRVLRLPASAALARERPPDAHA